MEMRSPQFGPDLQQTLQSLELCDGAFQLKLLRRLKKEILLLLPDWQLAPAREDYFLHQLNQAWTFEALLSLVSEVNSRHLQQNPGAFYALLVNDQLGFRWELRASLTDEKH